MKINQPLEVYLKQYFGHHSFREGQKEAIESVLEGKDSLVMLPTGTGKSVCYQLSGYLTDGLTVVVSPLLALMEDQTSKMRIRGEKRVAALNSLLNYSEKYSVLQSLEQLKFLFLSPEMLYQQAVINRLKSVPIGLFVVDEAHCISQWGFDFRPEYLDLGAARETLGFPVTMALTATATTQVKSEIASVLLLDEEHTIEIKTSVDRENIFLKYETVRANTKMERARYYISQLPKPGILYFSSKKVAEAAALQLGEELRIRAEVYHADIPSEDKMKIQAQFAHGELDIVCATSAFGMGIDKQNIRFVLHYHLPGSPEQYVQEFGRCGRDGKPSISIILHDEADIPLQKRLAEVTYPTVNMLKAAFSDPDSIQYLEGSEVQKELCSFYVDSGMTEKQATEWIFTRKTMKLDQLNWMERYVHSGNCLRKQVLHYFDEAKHSDTNWCCSNCQENGHKELYVEEAVSKNKEKLDSSADWKKRIKNMFRLQNC